MYFQQKSLNCRTDHKTTELFSVLTILKQLVGRVVNVITKMISLYFNTQFDIAILCPSGVLLSNKSLSINFHCKSLFLWCFTTTVQGNPCHPTSVRSIFPLVPYCNCAGNPCTPTSIRSLSLWHLTANVQEIPVNQLLSEIFSIWYLPAAV